MKHSPSHMDPKFSSQCQVAMMPWHNLLGLMTGERWGMWGFLKFIYLFILVFSPHFPGGSGWVTTDGLQLIKYKTVKFKIQLKWGVHDQNPWCSDITSSMTLK